jgi:hypothetical protein
MPEMMPRRRKHEQRNYCYILYYTHECVVCRLFLETYIALNDAKALKNRKSNHFLKVTQSYPRVQTKHCSLDIFLVSVEQDDQSRAAFLLFPLKSYIGSVELNPWREF